VDTYRLKYFQRTAEEGSISRAARILGIGQPALTRQLQLLEEDLGVTLFTRTRRGVDLTEAGERLRASTAGPLRQLELAVQYVASPLAKLERNMLLGIHETAVDILCPTLINSLNTVFPDAVFSIAVGSTDQLVEALLKGALDVALINPVPDERVFYREMLAEDLVVVGGPDCELEAARAMTFAEVVDLPLVIPRSPTGIGTALENAALRTKVNVSYRVTTDSVQFTKRLIEAGTFYSVLPLSACRREVEDARLRFSPLCEPVLRQHLGLAATSHLDLPRELGVKVGNTIREEVAALIKSGRWPAELLAPQPWNPRQN
jgi:LysR family transcriptional regulator, nitrogen assimilation regulatory protein